MAEMQIAGQSGSAQPEIQVIQDFGSLNTKATRPAIQDQEFSWIENWFPLGPGNLRTLYAEGTAIYTAPMGRSIIFEYSFNFGSNEYKAVFLDNGTAQQVKLSNGNVTNISSTPGTFTTALSGIVPACAQWESQFLIIVSETSSNGYWIWDGASLFGAGTLSPDVTMVNGGVNYNGSAVTITAYGGAGSGATFSATVANGSVIDVSVTNPGSGYLINDQVVLAISSGGSDNGAAATATINQTIGGVWFVEVLAPGSGYTTASVLSFAGGGGAGAQAVITGAVNGQITEITVINPGSGYTSAPTISASVGAGLSCAVHIRRGQITAFTVAAGGTNYQTPPDIAIIGDGQDASASATLTAGVVTSIAVNNPGIGYSYALVLIGGSNNAAVARATLMPFGVKGSTVETYQNHVWVGDTTTVLFTAPGATSNFAASSGGGAFAMSESFLRRAVTCLKQSNGFLYIVADSSVNVISNVQTSGTPATTTFNNSNVDPQVGTNWRDTVQSFGRALVFANPTGVYALVGGSADKVSDALDGLFENATFNTGAGGGVTPSAAVATIFGIRNYVLMFTTISPYSNTQKTLMTLWPGDKWFAASTLNSITMIASQEIDSQLTAWGNDSTKIYQLFSTKSSSLTKIFQTKLRADPSYVYVKNNLRAYMIARSNTGTNDTVNIGVDMDTGLGTPNARVINAQGVYGWDSTGFGLLLGITGTTTAQDVTIASLSLVNMPKFSEFG